MCRVQILKSELNSTLMLRGISQKVQLQYTLAGTVLAPLLWLDRWEAGYAYHKNWIWQGAEL